MSRRRLTWLAAALALFVAAALVMRLSDADPPVSRAMKVKIPRHMTPEDWHRMEARQVPTFLNTLGEGDAPDGGATETRNVDPLMALMPEQVSELAVVLEANAIVNSPVGKLLLDCIEQKDGSLSRLEEQSGLRLDKDIDRVAIIDGTTVLSGFFDGLKADELFKDLPKSPIGQRGSLWKEAGGGALVRWDKHLLLRAPNEAAAQAMVARLEAKEAPANPVLGEQDSYGEIYGVLGPKALRSMLAGAEPQLAERIAGFAERVELHVDTTSDVGIVANVRGREGAQGADDIGRSLGGLLSLARMEARLNGRSEVAELFDLARVDLRDSGFSTELAVPLPLIQTWLGDCRAAKTAPAPPAVP